MPDTKAPATSLSKALLLVDRALLTIPQLTVLGVGVSYRYRRDGNEVVAQQTKEQRATLYKEGSLRMVALCADWIKARLLRKSFDPRISSYGLKHLVEEFRMGSGLVPDQTRREISRGCSYKTGTCHGCALGTAPGR